MDNLELKLLFHMIAEHQDPPVRWDWKAGVCYNINDLYSECLVSTAQLSRIENLIMEWAEENFTSYPIPASPDAMHGLLQGSDKPEIDCFYFHHARHDMYTGTYGRSRREMCFYIAEKL